MYGKGFVYPAARPSAIKRNNYPFGGSTWSDMRASGHEWLGYSSIHGLSNLSRSTSVARSVLWLLIVCGFLTYLTLKSYESVSLFMEYRTQVGLEIQSASKLEYPAITICNNNPFRKSQVRRIPDLEALACTTYNQLVQNDTVYDYTNCDRSRMLQIADREMNLRHLIMQLSEMLYVHSTRGTESDYIRYGIELGLYIRQG